MEAVFLARIQFAFSIAFHFFFPPISIGLAYFLVAIEGIGFFKKSKEFVNMGKFFGKIFAITFGVGVGTGLVMSLQFGTNWGEFTKYVNDVFGSFLVLEVIFAFFIESSFLGIYLFARNRVPKWFHWISIVMVALGATLSAFWILTANSWMHTPAGFTIENGRVILKDFWVAVFNPSMLPRFFHTITASILIGSFFVCGILAYFVLENKNYETSKKILTFMIIFTFLFSIFQAVPFGHQQTVVVAEYQKEKLATIEGIYESGPKAPYLIFGLPSDKPPFVTNKIEVEGLLSFMFDLKGDYYIKGLKEFPKEDLPPFALTFLAFHIMVIFGVSMIVFMGLSTFLLLIKKYFSSKIILKVMMFFIPFPIIATQFGWITAEVGRQPWVVYKILKTVNAVSINVSSGKILFSIILMCFVYVILLSIFIYLVVKTVKKGPQISDETISREAK